MTQTNKNAQRLNASPEGTQAAAAVLAQGGLVAFPTETVYGLGADARDTKAVARIYSAKGRPSFNPLIVHVCDADAARKYAMWSATAQTLAQAFWPGPISFVLPLRDGHGLSSLVTAGLPSVALRVPANPTAQAVLRAFGGPVAAPSANPSGSISPTTADHVMQGLGDKIEAVVDAGPCDVGLESTIVGLVGTPQLLRPGGVPKEDIEAVLSHVLDAPTKGEITAPGQIASHYAPREHVRLNAQHANGSEVLLGFGDMPCDLNLSPTGDTTEAAARLFDCLHQLDAIGRPIAIAPIPMTGLGAAINDRLARAAAPR